MQSDDHDDDLRSKQRFAIPKQAAAPDRSRPFIRQQVWCSGCWAADPTAVQSPARTRPVWCRCSDLFAPSLFVIARFHHQGRAQRRAIDGMITPYSKQCVDGIQVVTQAIYLSPVWIRRCLARSDRLEKDLLQSSQEHSYGRSVETVPSASEELPLSLSSLLSIPILFGG